MNVNESASGAPPTSTVLIVGASRGLGLGLAEEYLSRGWNVIATVRSPTAECADLVDAGNKFAGNLRIERVDTTQPEQITALRNALTGTRLAALVVNAGIQNHHREKIGEVSSDIFNQVMVSNALGPLRIVEACADLVVGGGVIAVMSSYMGSVSLNTTGDNEVYRASKAALNSLLRSFAARDTGNHAFIALHPGWVRTEMGGERAPLDIATSVRGCVDVLSAQSGQPGVRFLNYKGEILAW